MWGTVMPWSYFGCVCRNHWRTKRQGLLINQLTPKCTASAHIGPINGFNKETLLPNLTWGREVSIWMFQISPNGSRRSAGISVASFHQKKRTELYWWDCTASAALYFLCIYFLCDEPARLISVLQHERDKSPLLWNRQICYRYWFA